MLRTPSIRAGAWSVILQAARIGIQTGVFLIYTRALGIAEIGAYSVAFAFAQLALTFVRAGVLETVITSPRSDPEFRTAAVVVSVCFGLAGSATLGALGLALYGLDSEQSSAAYLVALSVLPLVECLGIVPDGELRRSLRFRGIALRTITALSVSAAVSLGALGLGFGAAGLVAFNIAAAVISSALSILMAPVRLRRPRNNDLHLIAGPAVRVALSSLASGSIGPVSQIALGALAGNSAAGAYAVAQRLIALINAVFAEPVRQTALPLLSSSRADLNHQLAAVIRISSLTATILSPLYLGLAATADILLPILLSTNGAAAAPILSVLCFHYVALIISLVTTPLLLAQGRSGKVLSYTTVQALTGMLFAFAAAPAGPLAVAIAYVARAYLLAPLVLRQAYIHGSLRPRLLMQALAPPVASGVVMAMLVVGLRTVLGQWKVDGLAALGVSAFSGVLIYAFVLSILGRPHTRDLLDLAGGRLRL
jgi:O-antigen/teichoic acid export membrane protein